MQWAGPMVPHLVDLLVVQTVESWAAVTVVQTEVYSALWRADCLVALSVDQKDDCWAATTVANLAEHSGLLMVAHWVAYWAALKAAM